MSENIGTGGSKSALNLTAATLISATTSNSYAPRRLSRITVLVAGTTAGSVNDSATVAGAAVANQVFSIPNVTGSYWVDFPCLLGIVLTPGAGQTVCVSYD